MSRAIQDEFTDLPISRQRKWQLRRSKTGKCQQCGQRFETGANGHCLHCMIKRLDNSRKRSGHRKRYRSLSWRLQNGK